MEHNPHSDRQGDPVQALREWLPALKPAGAITAGMLTVIPLHAPPAHSSVEYRVLAAAIATHEMEIAETEGGEVPVLRARNFGALPVLITDLEEVVGGKQNRTVNTTLLVPPKSVFDIPVSCVEHGRWDAAGPAYQPGEAVYPSLRQLKNRSVSRALHEEHGPVADQAAIWQDIASRESMLGARSRTSAMHDAYGSRAPALKAIAASLPYPEDGPVGVVCLLGGQPVSADLFDKAETLRAYWPRLVRSYALEAEFAGEPAASPVPSIETLLTETLNARFEAFPSPGLGTDVRFEATRVVGAALVHQGVPVHTALFWQASPSRPRRPFPSRPGRSR